MSATATHNDTAPGDHDFGEPESPLARLSAEQIEQLGREFDAIHDEVYADLGDRDSRYIRSTIKLHRQLVLTQPHQGARVAHLESPVVRLGLEQALELFTGAGVLVPL